LLRAVFLLRGYFWDNCVLVFDLALMGESGKKREETGSAELTRVLGQRPKKNGPKTI